MSSGIDRTNSSLPWRRMRSWAPVALIGVLLAACAGSDLVGRASELEGHAGLLLQVKQFYEARARERNGICPSPLFDGVTRSQVVSDDGRQLAIEVGYYFRDTSGREFGIRRCRGFGRRIFTIARQATDDGERLEVIAMTGEQSARPFPSGRQG